ALRVGHEGLGDLARWQLDVIHGVAAQIGDIVHGGGAPVVFFVLQVFGFFATQQQFFRTQGEGDAFVLFTRGDTVTNVDRQRQVRTGDDGVVRLFNDQLAVKQVH